MKVIDNIVECDCGELHELDPNGMTLCCWIHCDCGKTICKNCGSTKIEDMYDVTDEDFLWCNRTCLSCDIVGCGECV